MGQKLRAAVSFTAASCVVVVVSSCIPVGGNGNDNVVDPNFVGAAPRDAVPGFMPADQAWMFAATDVVFGGFGGYVEYSLMGDAVSGDTCINTETPANLSFDAGQFEFHVQFEANDPARECRMDAAVDASECIPVSDVGPVATLCEFDEAEGIGYVGPESITPTSYNLTRFGPCLDPTENFASLISWGLTSMHPITIPFLSGPAAVGGTVAIGGEGDEIVEARALIDFDGAELLGCVDENPVGSVSIEGDTLKVILSLEGQRNEGGVGSAGSCRITFEGTLSYCALLENLYGPGVGRYGDLARFDGQGHFTTPHGDREMNVLYLTPRLQPDSEEPNGVRRSFDAQTFPRP